jgi:hypothetical protein
MIDKPSIFTAYICVEFGQTLLTLVEKFIMLPRSRSCTPTYIYCSYNGSMRKHVFHPLKNILLLHWERTQKKFVRNKCSKSFINVFSWNFPITEMMYVAMQK